MEETLSTIETTRLNRIEEIQDLMVDIKVKLALGGIDDFGAIKSDQEYKKLEIEYNNLLAQLPC